MNAKIVLEISLVLSLFLGLLYLVVWADNRGQKDYLWFGLIYVFNACYAVSRLLQFDTAGLVDPTVPPKLIFMTLVVLLWLSYGFISSFSSENNFRDKFIFTPLIILGFFIVLWSTELVLTTQPIQHLTITGMSFTGVKLGPFYGLSVFFVLFFALLLSIKVIRNKEIEDQDRRILGAGFVFIVLMGTHDGFVTVSQLKWVRLFDIGFLPIGFLNTYIQFSQYPRLQRNLEAQVLERTKKIRRIGEQLEHSERRYREIFEKGSDWIFIHDMTGEIKEQNFTFKKEYGWRALEPGHTNIRDFVPPRYQRQVGEYLNAIQEKEEVKGRISVMLQGNEEIVLEYHSLVLKDYADRPYEVRGTAREITQEIEALREKKNLEEKLIQAQKMQAVGRLAGGVAHDFNNILSPIIGHSEILLLDLDKKNPSRESVEEIYGSALRAKELVRQILTFSRQEKNEAKLMKIQPIIEEVLKMIRSTIPSGIEIISDIDPECGAIRASPTQIHQILMNVITNAHHALDSSAGTISVRLSKIRLDDTRRPKMDMTPGDYLCLKIKDTGVGMSDDVRGQVFEPFYTTKEKGHGTGMGLSVVHGIVESVNGAIEVNSEPDKGAEFVFYFPVAQREFEPVETQDPEVFGQGIGHILFVDDEKAILEMSGKVLIKMGYTVETQNDPVRALELFKQDPSAFDLVISDMTMPKMNGTQLAEQIKELAPQIPIILCTGYSSMIDEESAKEIGIAAYIMKPVSMSDLSNNIAKILGN